MFTVAQLCEISEVVFKLKKKKNTYTIPVPQMTQSWKRHRHVCVFILGK